MSSRVARATGADGPLGVFLLGARGSVAATAATGLAAVQAGLAPLTGLVTATAPFVGVPLPALEALVLGGADPSPEPLPARAARLADDGVVPPALLGACAAALAEVDERVVPGITAEQAAEDPAGALRRAVQDLQAFRARTGAQDVVVLGLTSCEPAPDPRVAALDAAGLAAALRGDGPVLPPSVVYAAAALEAGCGLVDFTPSVATLVPGLQERAAAAGLPLAGRDGKTGETLLKTALAPALAERALRVRSWSGTNLLGGGDGAALAEPDRRAGKLASKSGPLEAVLGPDVEQHTSIAHVADLGEWKTAWDLVHFEGFLGTRMKLQFTWEGCDSSLAAPLVLDLARLAGLALRAGRGGPLPELGYFFKDPVGSREHRVAQQFDALVAWASALAPVPVP